MTLHSDDAPNVGDDGSFARPVIPLDLATHLERTPLGMIYWDRDFRVTYWSKRCETLFGWQAEELVGMHFGDWPFVYQADAPAVKALADELISGRQQIKRAINRNYTRDGRLLVCEWFNSAIVQPDGTLDSILSFVQDITARHESEAKVRDLNAQLEKRVVERTEALRRSEQRYRAVVDTQQEIISRFTSEGTLTFVNPAYCRTFGKSEAQLVGGSLLQVIPPADHHWVRQWISQFTERGEPTESIYETTVADGSTAVHHWRIMPVERRYGNVVEWQAVGRDITAQRRVEEQLQLIQSAVDHTSEAVVITDADVDLPGPHILYANPGFEKLTGYPAAEAIGQNPRILQGPHTDRAVLDRLRACLLHAQPFTGETTNYRKTGEAYVVEWHVEPICDQSGRVTHFVSVQRDMTDKRLREQEAQLHRTELARVGRITAMGEMASGLAHELNQPLAAITTYLERCVRQLEAGHVSGPAQALPEASDVLAPMRQALRQARRSESIIKKMRRFVTKRAHDMEPTAFASLISNIHPLVQADANDRGVSLSFQTQADMPDLVCDAIQIEQIIVNLINNALDAVKDQPPARRCVHFHATRVGDTAVRITVDDQGPGIDAKLRAQLFTPFFTTKQGGMGMGLTVSQSIANDHGGELDVASSPQGAQDLF